LCCVACCLQIREENPRLARDSKVLRVTMDNVYEVFTTPRETTGLQGIHFRFMPDMSQVKHALQVINVLCCVMLCFVVLCLCEL
jgi:hypothetical protein